MATSLQREPAISPLSREKEKTAEAKGHIAFTSHSLQLRREREDVAKSRYPVFTSKHGATMEQL